MTDLKLTRTRAALLQAIHDGDVYRDAFDSSARYTMRGGRNVTARVQEVIRAGWAEQRSEPGDTWRKQIRLTDQGLAQLKGDSR